MAVDFQVVFPQESIRLNQIRLSPRSPLGVPRSLDVHGVDFRAVDEVLINDIPSPDVIILNRNRLLAQLPTTLQKVPNIVSVSVLSRRLTITSRSLIRFRISDTPGRVQGILRLIQLFLKTLLSTPGTDIFAKRSGGGALVNIGETFGIDEGGDIISDFVISVDTTARQIVSRQGRDPRIPRDERLLSARVTAAGFNRELGAIIATVELTSQAGRAAFANLEL
jgi:hypothetical protein